MKLDLRPWRADDREALAALANDPRVSANLRDLFPYPYTPDDASAWLARAGSVEPGAFAVEVDGALAGGIGAHRFEDVHRFGAEIGYWLGVPFWGRGIATRAVVALTDWAFAETDLQRLQATVYEWNPASSRVLEKAGYTHEGVQRRAVFKHGRFGDVHVWVRLR
jgi:RimJ/RimL family protein N-acetyltransferase